MKNLNSVLRFALVELLSLLESPALDKFCIDNCKKKNSTKSCFPRVEYKRVQPSCRTKTLVPFFSVFNYFKSIGKNIFLLQFSNSLDEKEV